MHNVHNRVKAGTAPRRLTAALWRAACRETLDGAPLLVPGPVDAIVFGLVLNRCWGSDAWRVKPRDYLDLAAVIERYGVARGEILSRARRLGVERTARIFLSRCDPYRERLRLAAPSWPTVRAWNLAVVPERGAHDAHQLVRGTEDLARGVWTVARLLPLVRRVRREVAAHGRADGLDDADAHGAPRLRRIGHDAWGDLRRGAHRCLRLLRVHGEEHDAVLLWTLRHALRRHGHDADVTVEATASGRSVPVLTVDGRALDMGSYLAAADRPEEPAHHDPAGTVTSP